ncbi:kinesin-like protein KIF6 isoform X2 [Oryzias latipes]|uniref:kinesin-like protein KIF6 isoform X2 n=1 Tax=Oryzias latipes TaxID=8090 RepID=UPI0005CBC09E|nr:kinesin-like protein KIF6 isoform X2 [Oryzias latipes]
MVQQTIQIFGRIKPTGKPAAVFSVDNEDPTGASLDFLLPRDLSDGFVNNKRESYKFRFKKVFDQHAKQEDIFENIARPVADSVLAGFNGAIFAYGQTGSGKTFTITGGAERYADRGIIPRTLSYLFERFSQDSSTVYTMHISYLEIYNELGYDLLDPRHEASRLEDLPKVLIMEDADQNIHLRNLSLQQAANEEEALNLLFLGDTNRMIAETPLNQASTRSHCIFTVHLCRREPGSATLQRSKLHLVDLAGSDRVSKTGLNGVLLTEAKYINLSLHFLEQVILALSERSRSHIPYRNSMLTSVLRDSLGGNCMTTMIATLAVDKRNLDESISTCRFAQRVALIKNEAILNEELDPVLLIAHLKEEILTLKKQLATMMGEQKDEQLTADEMLKLEEMIEAFLNDPDPDGTLSLGRDMRKVQHSFSYFKRKILEKESERHQCSQQPPAATQREDVYFPHMSPVDVNSLKEMLQQRDNEISILVKMLKKEKKRADDAAVQLSRITDCQKLSSQSLPNYSTVPGFGDGMADTLSLNRGGQASSESLTGEENMELGEDVSTLSKLTGQVASMCPLSQQLKSTPPQSRDGNVKGHQEDQRVKVYTFQESHEGNMNQLSLNHGGQVLLSMKKGSQLSAGKQEAFEIFIKDHEEQQIIEDHKQLIKKRSAEARTLSEQLNQVRNTIAELRKQLQTRRRQSAAQSVEVNQPPGEKFDPVEEELCEQIRREKIVYKSAIGRLKALSTEIEHLQLLLERVKVKIQKDFQKWWTQEASSLQGWEPGATAGFHTRPSSSGTPGLWSSVSRGAEADINPPSEWRTLDSTFPPTGDQQVDADVLAFVRARQSLLSKNTAPQR